MSDTPRTDKFVREEVAPACSDDFPGDRAIEEMEKLERENDRLAKQCVRNVEEIGTLRAEVRRLERERDGARACLKSWKEDEGADAKRFEFLMDWGVEVDAGPFVQLSRDDIDAAMEAFNNE